MNEIIKNPINLPYKLSKSVTIIASYIFICIVVIYLYYQIYLASTNQKSFTKNVAYNIITIVVPIIFILLLIVFTSFERDFALLIIFGSLFFCTFVFTIYYFLKTKVSAYIFNNYLLNTIIILLILIGLSIIFTIFSGTLRKLNGWTGFLANLLFYIPCLIRDFVKEIISEYNTSSNTVLILFIIEIFLIIMYFFVIPIINNNALPEKTVILSDPVMLNTEITLPKVLKDSDSNFAISMWIYLNSMPNTKESYTKETIIYNYYNKDLNRPHIKISYLNNERGSNDFIMQVGTMKYNISLPLQKWNNFVINYVTSKPEIPENTLKTKQYTNGVYKGQLKTNNDGTTLRNGYGKHTYTTKDIYEGQWLNNEKCGLGTYTTYSSGSVEDGIWFNDEQTHRIVYHETKTDNFSGKGQIHAISTSGNKYSGDIKDGVKHGYGTLTDNANKILKQGYWINDSFIGSDMIDVNPDISTKYMSNKNFTIDIFINGRLERSYTFKNDEIPIFKDSDIMMVGETTTKDGLYGSICNIVYYKKPLSQLAITYNYNLLTIRNPPI
jgi:hypothetical protein